jgi:hypothetical protein
LPDAASNIADQARHTSGGVSLDLPSDWEYHERLTWPGAWTPPGSDGAEEGTSLVVHSVDMWGSSFGDGSAAKEVDVPGSAGATYWHHDIPPEGGEGDDDYVAIERFGPTSDVEPTGEAAELPDLGDLPSGLPDGWSFSGPEGLRVGLPDGWLGAPGADGDGWIHPGTGARIRVNEAKSSDTWELTREGTRFTMPGADIAVASASVVTDRTGQELVEVQVDVRREGGRGYTAFVDAPAADLPDLLPLFLGSLSFQPEAGGTGWVNDPPEYPHLADPPASWTDAEVGPLRLAVPPGFKADGDDFWTMGSGQDEALLDVYKMDVPMEKQRPGQTSVRVDGATSVLVEVVKDHDGGPDFFVGTVEIVLESGDVYSIAYHAPGIEASEKSFGEILGSLTVTAES